MTETITINSNVFRVADHGQARRNDASHPSPAASPKKRHKYGARSVVIDGITFPSQREGDRWLVLKDAQRKGWISDLERQVPYVLAEKAKLHGEERTRPAIRYLLDFRYFDCENLVTIHEDTKGRDTPVSRIKRHLMKSVHGIDVVLS